MLLQKQVKNTRMTLPLPSKHTSQEIEKPVFNNLSRLKLPCGTSFFATVGKLVRECGIEFILTEASILAEGSMLGFIKENFAIDSLESMSFWQMS